jgi:two-component sensor histidine kinase
VQSRWTGAQLDELVTRELAPYCRDADPRVSIEGPKTLLEPNTTQAITVCLHELATNAAKYGALSWSGGHIKVDWSLGADERLFLRWTETGGPVVVPPARHGFGTRVIAVEHP